VADEVVANAMPVSRSIKAIANNSPWFLFIVIQIFTLFVKKNTLHMKKPKNIYSPLYLVISGRLYT
jgi:hypothetical protein